MKIINTKTNEVVAEIMTNHSMSLDEAIECAGEMYWDEEHEFQAVIIDDVTYDYDDLDIEG